jgi:hypothetical protein
MRITIDDLIDARGLLYQVMAVEGKITMLLVGKYQIQHRYRYQWK